MKKIYVLTFTLLSSILFTEFLFANKYYVNDPNLTNDIYTTAVGNNSNSGTTPGAPMLTLGAAITAASNGDTIYVDVGTYTGTGNISLSLNKSLTIIGAGTGNTIFTSHTNNRFVRIQANDVKISNMQIYDFFLEGTGQAIMVDANITGFVLTNIVMKRNLGAGNSGGASIYLSSGSETVINGILFSCSGFNGNYGGAIKLNNAQLTLNKSVFFQARDNDGVGGAIGISGAASVVIVTNSVFQECNSKAGGAIGQTGGILNVSGSCFTDNFIQGDFTNNFNGGGHYYASGTIVSASFSNCSFTGAFFCSTTNPPAGSICQFDSNPSNDGKAISIRGATGTFNFDTCYFNNNNISTSFDDGLDFYLRGNTCFVNINECEFGNDQFPSNSDKVNIYNYDVPSANFIVTNSGLAQLTANQDGIDGNNFSYRGNAPGGISNNNTAISNPVTSCANITIAGCDDISINCATEINSPVIITCATDKVITDCSTLGDYRAEVAAFDDCSFTISQNPAPGTLLTDGVHNVVFTVTDEAGNFVSCTISVTVSGCGCTPPPPPTGSSAQSFCSIENPTVADLIAVGSNIQWYDVPTGGTALATSVALVNNTTYYATQTIGGCESDTRLAVTVTIADPTAPTGSSAQSFCSIDNPTAADLVAVGSTIQWYDIPTGGTALATSDALMNGSTYYASQTIGSCESDTRLPVTVTIADPTAPTGSSAQSFCSIDNPTVADLVALGTTIQWYDVPTGGTALATSDGLLNGSTYYASQTIGSCESDTRLPVTVTIADPTAPTGSSAQSFCSIDNPIVADLLAVGSTIQWYTVPTGSTALTTSDALMNGSTYYASQTIGSCESDTRLPVTVTIADPTAPTGSSAQSFCSIDNPTVADLVAVGSTIQWYDVPTGGTALATSDALLNGSIYYASQTIGSCESDTRLPVTVTIADPTAPTGSSAQSFCSIDNPTVADLVAVGSTIQWYDIPTGGTALATSDGLLNGSTYYASQTVGSCESDTRLPVTVTIADPTAPTGSSAQSFCSIDDPTIADLVAVGSTIQWYTVPTGGTALATSDALLNGSTYYASQTIGSCESDTRLPVTVSIADPTAPTGSSAQSFCSIDIPTVADLLAVGSTIQWHTVPTGGTTLATSDALLNGSIYYASQTIGSCESDTRLPVTVTIADPTAPTGSSAQSFCSIDNPTVADLVAVGSTIQWYDVPIGGTTLATSDALVNGSTYYASQTVGSCESDTRLPVTVSINPNPTLIITDPSVCYGLVATIIATPLPAGNFNFVWSVPSGVNNPGNTASFNCISAGVYALTVTDINNCSASAATTLSFYDNPEISGFVTDESCRGAKNGSITTNVNSGTYPFNYIWSDASTDNSLYNISSGNYALTVSDANNCTDSISFVVNYIKDICLNIPTAFSPNGDGINDTWEIEYIGLYDEISIEIFNRWGQLIFSYSGTGEGYEDVSNRWDGTYNDSELPLSSFVFILDLKDEKEPIQGIVTIIK